LPLAIFPIDAAPFSIRGIVEVGNGAVKICDDRFTDVAVAERRGDDHKIVVYGALIITVNRQFRRLIVNHQV